MEKDFNRISDFQVNLGSLFSKKMVVTLSNTQKWTLGNNLEAVLCDTSSKQAGERQELEH